MSLVDGRLTHTLGYTGKAPRDVQYRTALAAELERVQTFLGLLD